MRSRHKAEDRPERQTILLVEEDAGVRELIGILLEHEGYAVATCDSILRARASICAVGPDLLILDPWTRGADRWDVLDGLGAELEAAGTPWIVSSTDEAALGRRDRLSARPGPSLSKPFELDALVDMVGRLIGARPSVRDEQLLSA